MKRIYILMLLLVVSQLKAQIGIQTTSPNAQLDVRSSNQVTPANTHGILFPKVGTFPATNPTAAKQGMLVYLTTSATFLATTRQPGFITGIILFRIGLEFHHQPTAITIGIK